jgi:hypothetical protein
MSRLFLIRDHKILSNNTKHIEDLYEITLDIIFIYLQGNDCLIFHKYFCKFIRYMIDTIEDDGTMNNCVNECEKISIQGKIILHKFINILNPKFKLENTLDKDLSLIYFCRKLVELLHLNKDLYELEKVLNIDINKYSIKDIFKILKIQYYDYPKLLKIFNNL